ncbi:GNAT family N-acetyltransferase [Agrobacterium rhizogenes]|uniref:GNAT family N-acetyltransferase n=1 Tax=Rhizobium rhizogenes TaxID=359 RepID=UPI00115E22BE|nr:GNAT family N-acetyltransferase [Rhizobium rhizogenes]NTG90862.1 GNAT family N-acetyltransferase [Rhizobium rhizogenes]NTI20135.1 GNAT family N-acetyltransferase [Rhizobium rhizogenes]NTI39184.1 GNAT family N-acetyltransferase [Rhizobium rhizogenes]TRB19855.1 N-acetyltransferase [Rhizobium rhizogenes]WEO69103.1 GNAT family N-acetyltransferase [Rhizobium rhizogenes]
MSQAPLLTTERLKLRTLVHDDKHFIVALISDEKVRRFLGGVSPFEQRKAAASHYFAHDVEKTVWMVETVVASQQVGLISISRHQDGEGTELSYQFHPDTWGSGYAIEATTAVRNYVINYLGRRELVAETQEANHASRRLLEKLGMRELRRLERFGAEQVIYIL